MTVLDANWCKTGRWNSEYGEVISGMVAKAVSLTRDFKNSSELALWKDGKISRQIEYVK